jgi:indolepyruvate ferredoxin oxidoreductase alpha subunit
MKRKLFLGDEAIAQAAIDAGLSGVYSYPGTPSTEITEYIQNSKAAKEPGIVSRWCVNEKTALETALGMSYAGKRTLSCMKHVGMNVAADAFMNIAMSGVNGGMIVVTADDPSMHSSQNEQDNRAYGNFAMLPMFEPSTQQEAYDMVYDGYDLSEKWGYPILLRITTRMAHSRAGVQTRESKRQNSIHLEKDAQQKYILLPVNARKRYKILIEKQKEFLDTSENSPYNQLFIPRPSKGAATAKSPSGNLGVTGIIACGIAFNYLQENFPNGFENPVLKISQYPLPKKQLLQLTELCDEILVLEDGYPIVEDQLKGYLGVGLKIHGRLDGTLQRDGELTPDKVRKALGLEPITGYNAPEIVAPRPPALCAGCGHRDVYEALNEVVKEYENAKVFSDIGCYTLGALPPFRAIDSCIDMGASITMARGAAEAGIFPAVAVIGDSTFTHSGMTGLLDCVNANANTLIIISDNETTAMTGGQDSAATGRIHAICKGIGVDPEHLHGIIPLKKNFEEMKNLIRKEIEYKGVSVIVPCRECIQTFARKAKQKNATPQTSTQKEENTVFPTASSPRGELEKKCDIILAGVGGQGILSIATVIGEAALENGLQMKQSEVHGMSQRGGDVQSHLRISSQAVASDLIPQGNADIIISLEPMEALRYLPYLKKDGWIVTSSKPFENISNYPDMEKILEEYDRLPNKVVIDVEQIAKDLGAPRSGNVVLLGAASPYIGIEFSRLENGIRQIFGKKGIEVVEINLKALRAGKNAGK